MPGRLVERPGDWPWSSVHAHLSGRDDGVTTLASVLERFSLFGDFIAAEADPAQLDRLRRAETIGRPVGDAAFIAALEAGTDRSLKPGKRGPKPREPD